MDPLSATASIIAILQLSSKVVGYLTAVKDASKERARCAIEASNLHSLLLNLRFRLEEGSTDIPWYTTVRTLAIENGPLDQFKQALETLQTRMTEGGRLGKAGEALMWKFKKEEIASILHRMERLKTLIDIALQMDHFKLSQAIKDDTRAIKDDTSFVRTHVPIIQSGVERIRQDQDSTKYRRLLEWISPTDYPAQQSDIVKRRQEGTGKWFLDAPEVVKWLSTPNGILFCPGIPGAGKTMLATIAINHLLGLVQNSSVGVAYIYCNYKAQEEQDTSSILAALLKQLVQARPSVIEPIERLHKQHANQGTKPSLNEIFSALQDVLIHYPTIYIVIDALDECRDSDGTQHHQLLAKLRDLQAGRDIRLMATSRFIPEIVDAFQEALQLEVRASEEDVRRFVAGQIYRLPRCIQRDSILQGIVQEKIVQAVDGMFLLARLHTDSLLDKRTVKDVKSTLAQLSKGSTALDDAYRDALLRIEGQLDGDSKLAKKVLSWIAYTSRPLTTAELCCALAVEPEEAELDPENIPDIEDLVSVCAGLIVINQESAIVRLVHYTTQEYFMRIKDTWNPEAQQHIASTCLTYLLFSTFRSGSCSTDEELNKRLQQNVFLDYAAKHWGEHARTVEAKVANLACLFLLQSGSLSCATQVMLVSNYKYENYSQQYPSGTTHLHLTARFGLPGLLKELLARLKGERVMIVNTKDSRDQTPLYLAARTGNDGMVKLLIDIGADINTQGGYFGNALQAASAGGYEPIVKLLVDNGADVNARDRHDRTILYKASAGGYEPIVKLLVNNGADVNARDKYGSTALYKASAGGYEPIVKLLVDNGADVNARDRYGSTALYEASTEGYEPIVKLLVNNGADVNARDRYDRTALYKASERGHELIVKLLVDNGADVNIQGEFYGTALHVASEGGHESIVKLLVDNGAGLNT